MSQRIQSLIPALATEGLSRLLTLDATILVNLRRRRDAKITRFMEFLTACGDTKSWVIHTVTLFLVPGLDNHYTGTLVAVATLLATAGVQPLKRLVQRRRPRIDIQGIEALAADPDKFSFPSGHTAVAFAVAAALAPTHPALAAAEFCFASSIGFSRMYLGAHYPLDVCVGAVLGMFCGIMARYTCAGMLAG